VAHAADEAEMPRWMIVPRGRRGTRETARHLMKHARVGVRETRSSAREPYREYEVFVCPFGWIGSGLGRER